MFLVSSCSFLCPFHWNQMLSRERRCSWSSADRRCSNYICVVFSLIVHLSALHIRDLTVCNKPGFYQSFTCSVELFWGNIRHKLLSVISPASKVMFIYMLSSQGITPIIWWMKIKYWFGNMYIYSSDDYNEHVISRYYENTEWISLWTASPLYKYCIPLRKSRLRMIIPRYPSVQRTNTVIIWILSPDLLRWWELWSEKIIIRDLNTQRENRQGLNLTFALQSLW